MFFAVTCILFFPVAVLIRAITGLFDRRLVLLHRFTSFWASLYTWLNPFWRVTLVKKTRIDPRKPYMMISNHQSMVDIFALFRTFFHFKWVSKSENFKFPFIGWNMRLNRYIEIDRGTTRGSVSMMRKAEATLKEGSSVFIFPEGTRSRSGELGSFKRGAFELAKKLEIPILPVVLDGSSKALPVGSFILKGLHRIRIHVLDPIPIEKVKALSVDELIELSREIIQTELQKMRAQLTGPMPS
jgi:1-acyl-sn-glycerol-3-phosphate acyltransferase